MLQRILSHRPSPLPYLITFFSFVTSLFAITASGYEVAGALLAIGAIIKMYGFIRRVKKSVSLGAMISLMGWMFVSIHSALTGTTIVLILLGVPNCLYSIYFYLACKDDRFWIR